MTTRRIDGRAPGKLGTNGGKVAGACRLAKRVTVCGGESRRKQREQNYGT